MGRTRVLVVEDSTTVRKRLCEVLASDPAIDVIADVENGKRAIEVCEKQRPDVVTMDMVLPLMNGLAATEYIMAHCPTPILICSSSLNRGDLFKTYEALAAGAVDVLEKPRGDETDAAWERQFIAAVKLVSRIRVITHLRARLGGVHPSRPPAPVAPAPIDHPGGYSVVAIGASTGGPAAIVEVLRALPAEFRLPVLLVLHINEPFAASFAEWLDGQTPRHVGYARDGDLLESAAGRVVMAPPDRHLVVRDGRLRLTRDAERHSCRPSVDVLFESLARECGASTAACLLTGMGRDGAQGLVAVRRAGGMTIAQDEATSIVYGMPREAVLAGGAAMVLSLGNIGAALAALGSRGRGARQK
jgi:two-component system, chemotaxis family, protein-glutamate methylesterase/glutaminase